MPVQETLLLGVINAVDNLHNADISGGRLSGRTTLVSQIARHFRSLGREVLIVTGRPMLGDVPLGALGLSGLRRDTPFDVAGEIAQKLRADGSVIAVDDWEYIDRESWAALVHVHQGHGIPLVTTRGVNRGVPGPFALPGIGRARSFEMPTYEIAALGKILAAKFGFDLDAQAMAHLAALSCGSAGVAAAVVASALEEEELTVKDGRATLTNGGLWTRGAAAIAETMLSTLDRRHRDGIERLSLLGPTPLPNAAKALGAELIAEMSDLDLVRLSPGEAGPVVTVGSALIDQFFLRHPNRVRHALLSADIGAPPAASPAPPLTTLTLLSDVYSTVQRSEMEARRAWEAQPTLGSAAAMIDALNARSAPHTEIDDLFEASAGLDGDLDDIVRWELLYLKHSVYRRGQVQPTLERLAKREAADPRLAGCVRAAEVFAAVMTGQPPQLDALPTSFEGLWPGTEDMVKWAKLHALTLGGRIDEARQLLADVDGRNPMCSYVDTFTITCLIRVADGEYDSLTADVAQRYASAKKDGRWQELASITYLSGLSVGFYGDRSLTQSHMRDLLAMGAPVQDSLVQQGIASGWVAAYRGADTPVPPEFTPDVPHPLGSPFPGAHPMWQRALELEAAGETAQAAEVATELANEQWAKGHRLAAALSYQLAATIDPSPERIRPLDARVRLLGAAGLDGISEWLRALCRGDIAAAEDMLNETETLSSHSSMAAAWASIARQWSKRNEEARAFAANRRAARGGGRDAGELTWSPREREVVRYVSAGKTNKEIAQALSLSVRTVESHVARAIRRVGVSNRSELRGLLLAAS
jgi:DNA-binding CsgD family transcriptional regulator